MKLTVVLLLSFSVYAQDQGFVAQDPKRAALELETCQKRVEAVIRSTAFEMGLKKKFGLQLTRRDAGLDSQKRALTEFSSGVFLVPEGYVSNSSASVTVRLNGKSCDILKLNVTLGQ